ncbi:MAG TPA: alanine--tRNA ligase [Acidobacteriota bacterium]|nr:alanine--tRNA ligase [Acidobacteriota bacterium]
MDGKTLKRKYLEFFKSKQHAIIPSAPLVPDNDPTVLFTTAGMHPLVPFLLGQPHPLGKRLADVQKCVRTGDIDDVGDATHLTFFEMLGNWSLGDYFKKESISWSYEFLTSKEWLHIPKERLAFTCFEGNADAPKDTESQQIWLSLGVSADRIAFLPKEDNWWGPAGQTGPCGPDTEIFFWKDNKTPAPKVFNPKDKNWVEIWNNVFMQYDKQADGTLAPLKQKCVDTGMGVERTALALQGKENVYETEAFESVFKVIAANVNENIAVIRTKPNFRIVADHIRTATFMLGDERTISPSNTDRGYILRRLIRRTIRNLRTTNLTCAELAEKIIDDYGEQYPTLKQKHATIIDELKKEEEKFKKTLDKGENRVMTLTANQNAQKIISGKDAFDLFQSYGFPLEMTVEAAKERGFTVDSSEFKKLFEEHQAKSRTGAEQKFKGGLADNSDRTVRLHTATHLLNEALRKVISKDIVQKGSNITAERLRFDFNLDRKLTPEEVKAVEAEVNRVIQLDLPITIVEMSPEEAKAKGAQSEFGARYPPKVTVYKVGDYSMEICMGPHVKHTKEVGTFTIQKEESSAAGIRRIKATVD